MKLLIILILSISLSSGSAQSEELFSDMISPHASWEFLKSSRYKRLPHYQVTYGSFISKLGKNILREDSKRTVREKNHFIPFQRKLIFPNGVCVRGTWDIEDHKSDYSGYFKANSQGVVIAR